MDEGFNVNNQLSIRNPTQDQKFHCPQCNQSKTGVFLWREENGYHFKICKPCKQKVKSAPELSLRHTGASNHRYCHSHAETFHQRQHLISLNVVLLKEWAMVQKWRADQKINARSKLPSKILVQQRWHDWPKFIALRQEDGRIIGQCYACIAWTKSLSSQRSHLPGVCRYCDILYPVRWIRLRDDKNRPYQVCNNCRWLELKEVKETLKISTSIEEPDLTSMRTNRQIAWHFCQRLNEFAAKNNENWKFQIRENILYAYKDIWQPGALHAIQSLPELMPTAYDLVARGDDDWISALSRFNLPISVLISSNARRRAMVRNVQNHQKFLILAVCKSTQTASFCLEQIESKEHFQEIDVKMLKVDWLNGGSLKDKHFENWIFRQLDEWWCKDLLVLAREERQIWFTEIDR